jgi:hypothetical protein
MKLIALVAVLVVIDGVRTTIPVGEAVTGLGEVDVAQLKALGAIADVDEDRADAKAAEKAQADAMKEFATARQAVQAKAAAVEAPALKPTKATA